jgi:GrpB-like predicted nucleotidyltransferase (UPF0157 family)
VRADPTLLAEYEALKLRLAEDARDEEQSYTAAKRRFVARVLATAGIDLPPDR